MASTKSQLEECKKPNPRYVLDFYTIRGMIQEADNMDKDLRTALGLKKQSQTQAPRRAAMSTPTPPPSPPVSTLPPRPATPGITAPSP